MESFYVQEAISTPPEKLNNDINQYLFPDLSGSQIENLKIKPYWEKICHLAERLEFINILDAIRNEISNKHEYTIDKKESRIVQRYKCTCFGVDCAGVHKDIEALIIYLLVTCIDTIMGKEKYISAFEWLKTKGDLIKSNKLSDFEEEYIDEYGLRRNFLKAWQEFLPSELQKEWCESYSVVRVDQNRINEESLRNWRGLDLKKKIKKIADLFYTIRSQDTHTSKRVFNCNLQIENNLQKYPEAIFVKMGSQCLDIIPLLKKTICAIAREKLISCPLSPNDK